ncbi:hypothetical protein DPMN_083274 [Dreissena polymorpha]|uniref:Uncharacterized protein n=1 Tax=Dreissena polymorpha TaxID=45954 RepID=A0A9D4BHJ6_DREPO|nr:hypothetical protein DPMN_083274 [Dreissena polymorpha]
MNQIQKGNPSPRNPNEKGRDVGLETTSAATWMQVLSRFAKHAEAAGETRQEPRRIDEAGFRSMSQTGPNAKMKLKMMLRFLFV